MRVSNDRKLLPVRAMVWSALRGKSGQPPDWQGPDARAKMSLPWGRGVGRRESEASYNMTLRTSVTP